MLLLNFFRTLPRKLEDAAFVDGSGHWTTPWKINLPLSNPALATIGLLTIVFQWNSWFDDIIFMNSPAHYPLQSSLETLAVQHSLDFSTLTLEQVELMRLISGRSAKAAQIFIAAVLVLAIYFYLQRYFVKRILLGSVTANRVPPSVRKCRQRMGISQITGVRRPARFVERKSLSQEVASLIKQAIVEGALATGERIVESKLAITLLNRVVSPTSNKEHEIAWHRPVVAVLTGADPDHAEQVIRTHIYESYQAYMVASGAVLPALNGCDWF